MGRWTMILATAVAVGALGGAGCKEEQKPGPVAKGTPSRNRPRGPSAGAPSKADPGATERIKAAAKYGLPHYTPKIQLLPQHIHEVAKVLKQFDKPKLLIWGVGYDSRMWCALNKKGTTFFIEDNCRWAHMTTPQIPCRVILAKYGTRVSQADQLIKKPEALKLTLPPDILQMKFDVLVVDAPDGSHPRAPGRMKSIYMSTLLSHERSHVFVDDFKRPIESKYGDRFLGAKYGAPRVHAGRNHFAHFANGIGPM